MVKKALITGGEGDIAKEIKKELFKNFSIYSPGVAELDVSKIDVVKHYCRNNGPFDLVINNAGTIHPKRILESDETLWVRDIMVNLVGPYYVAKQCLEQNPGTIIINIASTAAYAAYKDWSSYCSSKAGLVTFTKSLANDNYEAYGVAPGAVLTKFRNYFDLSNANAIAPEVVSSIISEILQKKYKPGDIIFVRKMEKKIL